MRICDRTQLQRELIAHGVPGIRSTNSFARLVPRLPQIHLPGKRYPLFDADAVLQWLMEQTVYPPPVPAEPPSLHRRRGASKPHR